MNRSLAMILLAAAATLASCGDVNKVSVSVAFPDDTVSTATKQLLFVVRQAPPSGNGCAQLWTADTSSLPQNQSTIAYPYKNDVVAAPIDLNEYPALSLLVYAFPTGDVSQPTMRALAGGCQQIMTSDKSDVLITLEKRPGSPRM